MTVMRRPHEFASTRGGQAVEVVRLVWGLKSAEAIAEPAVDRAGAEAQACLAWLADSFVELGAIEPLPEDHGFLVAAHFAFASRAEDYWQRVGRVLDRLMLLRASR